MTFGSFRLNTLSAAVSAAVDSITATGGTISYYTSGATIYKVHTFTTTGSNSFVVSATTGNPTADILLVGGGGAGGGTTTTIGAGGGGGGGAVVYQTGVGVTAQTYTISVGAGGTGVSGANGGAGSASTGLTYTANGGGAGTFNSAATNGGGSGTNTSTSWVSTIGTYAYKGGNAFGSTTGTSRAGGGGAGAGAAGVTPAGVTGGNAGIGVQNNIDNNNYYYGHGGGGGGTIVGSTYDPTGVFGTASGVSSGAGTDATNVPNVYAYGTGGGGARNSATTAYKGGNGAPGIGIIRYPVSTARPQTVTNNGTYTTAVKKYGTGSIQLVNPNTNSLTSTVWPSPIGSDANDFTIEGWFYFSTAFASGQTLYGLWGTANQSVGVTLTYNNIITLYMGANNYSFTLGITLTTATWYHIAITRTAAGSTKLWINGTQRGTTQTTSGSFFYQSSVSIGYNTNATNTGTLYVDDFRISNTLRYTTTFTAPAAAFVNDANTVLLVHMDSATPTDDTA